MVVVRNSNALIYEINLKNWIHCGYLCIQDEFLCAKYLAEMHKPSHVITLERKITEIVYTVNPPTYFSLTGQTNL